jgi:hypothetical protein
MSVGYNKGSSKRKKKKKKKDSKISKRKNTWVTEKKIINMVERNDKYK